MADDLDRLVIVPVVWQDHLWSAVVALRFEVYVDEQAVPKELELDEWDENAQHFAAVIDGDVAGTIRVSRRPVAARLGRLAVARPYRRQGIASRLMTRAVDCALLMGVKRAELDAQVRLIEYYGKFGFQPVGKTFYDAGILHIRMVRDLL
jgi:predicted GNAT family N-acyltransferase